MTYAGSKPNGRDSATWLDPKDESRINVQPNSEDNS